MAPNKASKVRKAKKVGKNGGAAKKKATAKKKKNPLEKRTCTCGDTIVEYNRHRKSIACVLWHLNAERRKQEEEAEMEEGEGAREEQEAEADTEADVVVGEAESAKEPANGGKVDVAILARQALQTIVGELFGVTGGEAFPKVQFDIQLADKLIDWVFCSKLGYSRAEIARFARCKVFSFKVPISRLLGVTFVVPKPDKSSSDTQLSSAYYEWIRDTDLFQPSDLTSKHVDIAADNLEIYLEGIPSDAKTGNNFKTDTVLAATQQFYIADVRKRMRDVFGLSFSDVDEWLKDLSEVSDRDYWNAVIVARILMRTLPSTWSCAKLTEKFASKGNKDFRKDVYSQLLPAIRNFAAQEIAFGKDQASSSKKGLDCDAGIARAAEVAGISEEDMEALIKGSTELSSDVVQALSVGASRGQKGPKAIRLAYGLYLSR